MYDEIFTGLDQDPVEILSTSFEEAFELSYFGAKVLHPGTMLPALERDIAIRILNSRRPDGTGSLVSSAHGATAAMRKPRAAAARRLASALSGATGTRARERGAAARR